MTGNDVLMKVQKESPRLGKLIAEMGANFHGISSHCKIVQLKV